MKNNLILMLLVLSVFMFSLSLVSANTFVIGKIYNADFSQTIDQASVTVVCQGKTKTTTSLSDGTYAIGFELSECANGSIVSISSTKANLAGNSNAIINNNNETDYFGVGNINMKVVTQNQNSNTGGDTGGSSGGSRFYLCGNGICDSGETASLCPQDCKQIENTTETNQATNNVQENEQTTRQGTTGITGAVIGAFGDAQTLGIFVLIGLILGLSIAIYLVRKRARLRLR